MPKRSASAAKTPQRSRRQSGAKRLNSSATPKENSRAPGSFVVVGVGASAGGMEAFLNVLRNLPSDIPAALVFVSHLDPNFESTMDSIFQRETRLRVRMVHEAMPIQSGHVYVVPSNRQLELIGGILQPEARRRGNGQFRPIDLFFHSLARDQGNSAIGILLSGNGTDGVVGLEQIKAEGGITFAQSEGSATFPTLPMNAAASGCVDFVLPPEAIAQELRRISKHPVLARPKATKTDPAETERISDLERVFSLLRGSNGVDFSFYKQSTLRRRIFRRMVLRKIEKLRDYVAYLEQHSDEVDLLFHDLLINVTSFFRDPPIFQALRRKVFPKFVQKRGGEPVRVWVPGCSTGEEVYSLAIALFEFFGKHSSAQLIQIFATDISEIAMSKARAGIYPESLATHVSADRLKRFFHKLDSGGYQIAKFVRDACVFARQNLIEDPPFSKLDLISCRNVLIYLGPVLQRKVIPIFHYALKPGGHLLLGGSETIGAFAELFTLFDKKNRIYIKRDVSARPEVDFVRRPLLAEMPDVALHVPTPSEVPSQAMDLGRQVDRLLLAHYSPSGVLINPRLEILQFRGETGAYLEHAPGDATLNLLKLLRHELIVDVRSAITRAEKADKVIRKENIEFTFHGKTRAVDVEVIPFKSTPSTERFFLLLFKEGRVEPRALVGKKTTGASSDTQREIARLRDELGFSKQSLQAIIEEQEASNEELKSANEEIQSSNEELQSTNEELETAKEELQSTNEELTTLNEELQTRNAELNQLNDDLKNLLSSVSMPILMLGNDLTIRRFTPVAERFFNLIPSDVGRRITDINSNIKVGDLVDIISEVIETLKTQEHDVQDREGRWYSMRIRPYRTSENKIDGAVVMLVDVDEIKRALTEFVAMVEQPLLTLRGDLRVETANEAFHRTFQTTAKSIENRLVYDIQDGAWNFPALKNLLEGALPEKGRVDGIRIEHNFGSLGRKSLVLSARRIYQRSKGTQITLLAFSELPSI